ncbi:hypothetical protein Q8W71_17500 [Methylobacterium sp. NEAU 140]|uniref:hypothetical protein n=1 Tax=Methylobacterium sp. NEAU 140 TaxID=3064945 RepID=UPI002732873A|nr:hypothetical protein [Methylobacterium sp. NEAU 140]MDP4024424.1 hypothetical protein [Methylobacterium sp. NEAU 140]
MGELPVFSSLSLREHVSALTDPRRRGRVIDPDNWETLTLVRQSQTPPPLTCK